MEVMNMHRVSRDVIAKLIGLAINPRSHSPSRHPHSKASWVMISAVVLLFQNTLAIIGTAKLSTPYHQCFIQQTPLFKIPDQSSACPIGIHTLSPDLCG